MQLLVSVGNPAEARSALEGGADLIDAKDARSGPLGRVSLETLGEIHRTVSGRRPVTAALGDAGDTAAVEHLAQGYARAGAAFVKLGFAGIASRERVGALARAAVRGVCGAEDRTRVVAVAYADAERAGSLAPPEILKVAVEAGMHGFLIDTADKDGPGLSGLAGPSALADWITDAHRAGLFAAVAGKLTIDDFAWVGETGADIAGVRGAACEGGRNGQVVARRVRLLRERCGQAVAAPGRF